MEPILSMLDDCVEVRLREALVMSGRTVYDHESSVKTIPLKKTDATDLNRFLAWNVLLGVLNEPEANWVHIWLKNNDEYWENCQKYQIDVSNWMSIEKESEFLTSFKATAQPKILSEIIKDVYRTCITLTPIYYSNKSYNLPDCRRIARIMYYLALENETFGYIQGYDRMAFIMYVLSSNFCGKNNLPIELAESIAYSMTLKIIANLNFRKHMESELELTIWIQEYQEMLERYRPDIAKRVQSHKIVPIQYTFRWVAVMFADEHKSANILEIWDNCMLHLSNLDKYLFCMAVAHISEAHDICRDDKNFIEFLHKNKDWDVQKIIDNSNTYYKRIDSPPSQKSACCVGILGSLWT